jgi:predicted Rossmann-fold nucleotide-binding protein
MDSKKNQFLRPSPPPASTRTIDRLADAGKRNNIVAHQSLIQLHDIYSHREVWKALSPIARGELTQMRSLGFDGYYPDTSDFERIEKAIGQESEECRSALENIAAIKNIINQQETLWSTVADTYSSPDLIRLLQDTTAAMHHLPDENGGRIVSFGSARTATGSDVYDSARWINETIVTGSLREDGTSEQVITGAGPGIMEAANYGAMQGRWNIMNTLNDRLALASENTEDESQVHAAIFRARIQMHSIGVRIDLPFEASWNEHLQLCLTIKNFAPRKGGLVSAAMGRSVSHNGNEHIDNPNHPAVFAFPGGFGTDDETWEAALLIQCGKMPNMPILAIGKEVSDKIHASIEVMEKWNAISPDDWGIITECKDEIDAVEQYHAAHDIEMSEYTKDQVTNREPVINNGNDLQANGYRQ